MIYDAFAHLPIYGVEDLGFVPRGKARAFITRYVRSSIDRLRASYPW
jgi:hypothetical protein